MHVPTPIDYKTLYEQAQAQLEKALGTIALLQHRIEQLEKLVFGSKQERFVSSSGVAALDIPVVDGATQTQQITYTRNSKGTVEKKPIVHPGRHKLPDHLRREDIVLEPAFLPKGSVRLESSLPNNWNTSQPNSMLKGTSALSILCRILEGNKHLPKLLWLICLSNLLISA